MDLANNKISLTFFNKGGLFAEKPICSLGNVMFLKLSLLLT